MNVVVDMHGVRQISSVRSSSRFEHGQSVLIYQSEEIEQAVTDVSSYNQVIDSLSYWVDADIGGGGLEKIPSYLLEINT
jgi:hypothetical protein